MAVPAGCADDSTRSGATTDVVTVTQVIDGDTVEVDSGDRVRLIGIDTPERGTCGADYATVAMRRLVQGRQVTVTNPANVQDRDKYDRLLRFIDVGGRDAGLDQLESGRARPRYDSQDGYDRHPREDRYHAVEASQVVSCNERSRRAHSAGEPSPTDDVERPPLQLEDSAAPPPSRSCTAFGDQRLGDDQGL